VYNCTINDLHGLSYDISGGQHALNGSKEFEHGLRESSGVRGGRRPIVYLLYIGRAVHESNGFDKESRSMKRIVPNMGPNTDFK
jgi:hypothetical protein